MALIIRHRPGPPAFGSPLRSVPKKVSRQENSGSNSGRFGMGLIQSRLPSMIRSRCRPMPTDPGSDRRLIPIRIHTLWIARTQWGISPCGNTVEHSVCMTAPRGVVSVAHPGSGTGYDPHPNPLPYLEAGARLSGTNRPDLRLVDSPKPTLDPFTMRKGKGYDPDEVYIRSTDGHGNSDNVQVRVPIEVSGEVAAIVAMQLIPDYRTPADFVRDAIVHRLHYVAEKVQNPELRRFVTVQFQLSRVIAERAQIADLIKTVEEMAQLCQDAQNAGDTEALGRAIERCEDMAEAVRDPYAGQIREIRKKYLPIYRRMNVGTK